MKQLFFLLGALLALPQAAWPQTPVGFALQAQTVQGVTIRLTQARWQPLAQIMGFAPGVFEPGQALVVSGTVSGDPAATLPDGKTQMDFVSATLLGPQGQRLHGWPLSDGGGWRFDGLDPRWPAARLQFERTDPVGAPGAAGELSRRRGLSSYRRAPRRRPSGPGASNADHGQRLAHYAGKDPSAPDRVRHANAPSNNIGSNAAIAPVAAACGPAGHADPVHTGRASRGRNQRHPRHHAGRTHRQHAGRRQRVRTRWTPTATGWRRGMRALLSR